MCGIIGYVGRNNSIDIILDGLKKLEYRGYDSAGIAYLDTNNRMDITRCRGKINELVNKIDHKNLTSHVAIGHTRWATHGKPSEENAHPHKFGNIAIVHNGIIENYLDLKIKLKKEGHDFSSDTDTEIICHLIAGFFNNGNSFENSVREAAKLLKGSYAIAAINEKEPERIVCIRKDSPLIVGLGEDEYFAASDVPAFLNYSRKVIFLEDGDMAILSEDGVILLDSHDNAINREPQDITWSPAMAEKSGYRHFMLKEIYEQPRAIADTIRGSVNIEKGIVNLYEFGMTELNLTQLRKIFIVACGTSWHAALCAKYMIEDLAGVAVEVDIASEFRYRKSLITKDDLLISITQSGETADTLAALREVKKIGTKTLTICNVVGSTASRESDFVFHTHAGPEIGVASTKAFTTQLAALYLFALALRQVSKNDQDSSISNNIQLIDDLLHLPALLEDVLSFENQIETLAKALFSVNDFLYLARGVLYPIALEGALKLKEISYIHAEGYPAGEMKHGPIALIDEGLPVVVLLSRDFLYHKVLANIEEVKSRGGKAMVISNYNNPEIEKLADYFFYVPQSNQFLNPIIMSLPLQLLAYHIAVIRGCDVDQPRNLAKSVTVE